jgi:hypothetical protein
MCDLKPTTNAPCAWDAQNYSGVCELVSPGRADCEADRMIGQHLEAIHATIGPVSSMFGEIRWDCVFDCAGHSFVYTATFFVCGVRHAIAVTVDPLRFSVCKTGEMATVARDTMLGSIRAH